MLCHKIFKKYKKVKKINFTEDSRNQNAETFVKYQFVKLRESNYQPAQALKAMFYFYFIKI